jgi:hypothetical protein
MLRPRTPINVGLVYSGQLDVVRFEMLDDVIFVIERLSVVMIDETWDLVLATDGLTFVVPSPGVSV